MTEQDRPLGIDPFTKSYEGPLRNNSLNAFFALPNDLQPIFLQGLRDAVRYLDLRINQFAQILQKPTSSGQVQKAAYEDLADSFAQFFDSDYRRKRSQRLPIDPDIEELRTIFYRMIRPCTQRELIEATQTIPLHMDWESFRRRIVNVPLQAQNDIQFAYFLAQAAHQNQFRESGEPFFTHPREVAVILLEVGIQDPRIIIGALLHDVFEDTEYLLGKGPVSVAGDNWDRIAGSFDAETAQMVEDLTKLNNPLITKEESEQLYFSALRSASSATLLIKMADRLHNLRTLDAMSPKKRRRTINETKNIYLLIFRGVLRDYPMEGNLLLQQINAAIVSLEQGVSSHRLPVNHHGDKV